MSASKWANPYKLRNSKNVNECLTNFESHLLGSQHLMNDILDLCGRRLVCHCKPAAQCHGDVLIRTVAATLKMQQSEVTLLIGVPFTPEEFVLQASWLEHPFQEHFCSEVIMNGLFQRMAMSTKGLKGCRADALEFWQNRKADLAHEEKQLQNDLHPNVQRLMASKSVKLFREMLLAVGMPNVDRLVAYFTSGFPLVGEFPETFSLGAQGPGDDDGRLGLEGRRHTYGSYRSLWAQR